MNERRGGVHISCTAHPVSHRYAVLADLECELRSPRTPPGEGEGRRAPIQFSSSQASIFPRRQSIRALQTRPSQNRGRRECRVFFAPAASCVTRETHELELLQVRRTIRHSLREWFYSLLRALPGDRAWLPPSPARCASIVARLISASGYQDHTASPSAERALVSRAPERPSHPASRFVTIAHTPLFSERDGSNR
jgi:hypothetical protein